MLARGVRHRSPWCSQFAGALGACLAAVRLLAAGCALLGAAAPAGAATLHVWAESPAPAEPYRSKLTAALRVQQALDLAKAGDTVLVHGDCDNAAGRCTYRENIVVPCGVTLSGEGTPPATPILDGGGAGRVITGAGDACTKDEVTTIARLEIQNGKPERYGGGIYLFDRRAVVTGNCLHDNRADVGAGIAVRLQSGDYLPRPAVRIEGNLIENNVASERGGGVTIEDSYTNPGKITDWHAIFDGNTVRQNRVEASSGARWGGGLDVYHSRVRARRNLFERNTIEGEELESYGAHVGVFNHNENVPLNQALALTLKDPNDLEREQYLSEDNVYRGGGTTKDGGNIRGGGAVAAIWNASVRSVRDWISANQANTGGAFYVNVRSLLELDTSHLENNTANGDGGGAYVVCDSRLTLNGNNLLERNIATGSSMIGGERLNGSPTPYPRGGGGLYVRNARAELKGKNVLRENTARGMAARAVGLGGGLLLWQVDKALLFPDAGVFAELEAVICNGLTHVSVRGDNLFEGNFAQDDGGGIAILLEADRPGRVQRAGTAVLGERPFRRSEILTRTQLRGNRVPETSDGQQRAGGLYYQEALLPGARQPAGSKWAIGQALVQGTLFDGNQGFALKLVDTGLHLLSADGRLEWIQHVFELADSTVQGSAAGGLTLWGSWPRVVGNQFLGNRGEQLYAQGATHLPVLMENHFDGAGVARAGVSVISAPAAGASPRWGNRFETNNLVGHTEHAAELELATGGELHMERNYWGANGPVMDDTDAAGPANSVAGAVLTAPPLTAAVNVPAGRFERISVSPAHPAPPALPECRGVPRDAPPGVPEEPPGRPRDATVPTPRLPDRSVPDRPAGEPPVPPREPQPLPEPPRSADDRSRSPEPGPPPEPSEDAPPSEQPAVAAQPAWILTLAAGRVSASTLGAANYCSRRHRFEIALDNLPFLRLLEEGELRVEPGDVERVPIEIDTRGLTPGAYQGVVTIRCASCWREPACAQDRTLVPVQMTVLPAER